MYGTCGQNKALWSSQRASTVLSSASHPGPRQASGIKSGIWTTPEPLPYLRYGYACISIHASSLVSSTLLARSLAHLDVARHGQQRYR